MPSHELVTVVVILLVIGLVVATFLELKVLRKNVKARRVRAAKRADELPDEAHNALITAKAIASALERGGVSSEEVDGMLREAQTAYDRRNYRVVLDLTSKAKEKLTALKARHTASGDLAKLEALPTPRSGDEPTTKERLAKDFPPHMTSAKFTMELAEAAIARGREGGRDVAQAEQILLQAQTRFEGHDYAGALATARQAQRSAEVGPIEGWTPPAGEPIGFMEPVATVVVACGACGTPLAADDLFCGKCGARAGPPSCPTCGATLSGDDAFCRKCGAKVTP
jgi:ribosomal protein L40E